MTCIISLEQNGKVYLGGDSYIENDSGIPETCVGSKVFRIQNLVFGICGSVRCEQILKRTLREHVLKPVGESFVEQELPELLIEAMDGMLQTSEAGLVMPSQSLFLLGVNGKAFILEDDFSVWRSAKPWNAIGAGAVIAKSAFEALSSFKLAPQDRLERVLNVAQELSYQVRKPFTFIAA